MNSKKTEDQSGCYQPSPALVELLGDSFTVIQPWLTIYQNYKGVPCSPTDDYRQFRSWVGLSPDVAEMIYYKYPHPVLLSRERLLLVLNWLKCMPSQNEGSSSFHLSRPTYRKYLWETINYLDLAMKEVSSGPGLGFI